MHRRALEAQIAPSRTYPFQSSHDPRHHHHTHDGVEINHDSSNFNILVVMTSRAIHGIRIHCSISQKG